MKNLLLCAFSMGFFVPAVHSATLVAGWTDFGVQSQNGFSLNLSGSSHAEAMGYLYTKNSTATSTGSVSGGELANRSDNGGTGRLEMLVTMTFNEIALPASGVMPLFSTRLSGTNSTYWGVGLTSDGKLQGLWNQTPWTGLTSGGIDLTTPFTLTASFSNAGTILYVNGAKIATATGLRSAAGNYEAGNDFLFLGGVETATPNAGLSSGDFTLRNLYIHKGVMTDTEVGDFYSSVVIPEPSTYGVLAVAGALAGVVALRRRKRI